MVDADLEITVERLVASRGFDEADARARIANQASREARRAVADWVIDNSGDLAALNRNIDEAWKWITSLPHTVPG